MRALPRSPAVAFVVVASAAWALASCSGSSGNGHSPDGGNSYDGGSGLDARPNDATTDAAPPGDSSANDAAEATTPDATQGDATTNDAGGVDAATDAPAGDAAMTGASAQIGTSLTGSIYGAASADGSAMLLVATGGGSTGIQYSHYEPGSGWSPPAPIPGATSGSTTAQVGIDGAGNAFAVWLTEQVDGGTAHWSYAVARYDHASQSWGAVASPDMTGASLTQRPVLSVNGPGEALVIDPADASGPKAPLYAEHYANGTWTEETVLSAVDFYVSPHVYLDDSGNAVAAVHNGLGSMSIVTRSGTTWTASPLTADPLDDSNFGLATNAAGDVLVASGEGGSSVHPVAYQYDATNMQWSGPTSLSAENETAYGSCPYGVALGSNGDGVVLRCWFGTTGLSRVAVEAYTFTKGADGGTWSAPSDAPVAQTLPDGGLTGNAGYTSFAVDSSLVGFASYINNGAVGDTGGGPVQINPFTFAGGWDAQSAPENSDAGPVPQYGLTSFISPTGRGWTAWSNGANILVAQVM